MKSEGKLATALCSPETFSVSFLPQLEKP